MQLMLMPDTIYYDPSLEFFTRLPIIVLIQCDPLYTILVHVRIALRRCYLDYMELGEWIIILLVTTSLKRIITSSI